jgi:hypothetical protein
LALKFTDLKPPDFFVWGFVKNIVYAQDIDNLKTKIATAFMQMMPEMLNYA